MGFRPQGSPSAQELTQVTPVPSAQLQPSDNCVAVTHLQPGVCLTVIARGCSHLMPGAPLPPVFVQAWAECTLELLWEGVPTAKGQTVHCLMLGAQPTASRLCGLHQPLPPGLTLVPRQRRLGGEAASKTGFPSFTEHWLAAPSDPHVYLAAFRTSPLTRGPHMGMWSALLHVDTASHTLTDMYVHVCASSLYVRACTPSLLLTHFPLFRAVKASLTG